MSCFCIIRSNKILHKKKKNQIPLDIITQNTIMMSLYEILTLFS
jgi:hypothetical protein